jgi:membrane-associated protease RseP (regulator of RpoE activity)
MRTQEMIARVGVLAIALLFALVMFNDIKGLVQTFFR